MEPRYKLISLALFILLFGTVPAVQAVVPTMEDFSTAPLVYCEDPLEIHEGSLDSAKEVDYYSIDLVAGQALSIDVDAQELSSLDSLLELFDSAGNPIAVSDDDKAPGEDSLIDPYLEITVEVDGTYYFAISAASAAEVVLEDASNTGPYTFFIKCSDPSIPPEPVEPVKVGDLLGATSSDPGSLLNINPADGASTVRFPFEYGKIADIEFNPDSKLLFVATDSIPGRIIVVDPDTGSEIKSFTYEDRSFLALESVENILFGIYVEYDLDGFEYYSLATIDQETGVTSPVVLSSTIVPPIKTLAYHPVEKVLYGADGADLIKFDLTSSPGEIKKIGSPGLGDILALDFSPENVLYCVENLGILYKIPDPSLISEQPVKVGSIATANDAATLASTPSKAPVSGLTFVVGESPQDDDQMKTICSSSFTSPGSTDSQLADRKLARLQLKTNPLHRGIGLFKFQGTYGEILTLNISLEESEPAEAEEHSAWCWLKNLLKKREGKNRVFVGIRDAIPGVTFRAREKGTVSLEEPLEMVTEPLPSDGWYYIMVMRPLSRFQDVDYCISLQSSGVEVSQAWQTLDVVWPGDDSEEDTAATSIGEKAVSESVDQGSDQVVQEVEETTTEGTVEPALVKETTTEVTEQPAVMDAPQITEETTVEPAPVKETTAKVTEQPAVTDAPQITEETTVEPVPVEETTAEVTEQPAVMGAPPITE